MKVVYKKTVMEQIKEAISFAATANKEIQCIELSTKEFDSLVREDADNTSPLWEVPSPPLSYFMQIHNGLRSVPFMGVTIKEVKELE